MARDFAIRNPKQLLENMVLIRDILQEHNIRYFLHFGTLLGAIREHDFIPHDDDADVGVFDEDFDRIINLIPEFLKHGFTYELRFNGRLLQFWRGGEQVDFFFAVLVPTVLGKRWDLEGNVTVRRRYLERFEIIEFPRNAGEKFLIPCEAEKLMRFLYGKTWRIPIANMPSRHNLKTRIRRFLAEPHKIWFFIARNIKRHIMLMKIAHTHKKE